MSYGMWVLGSHGAYQIDQNYSNLAAYSIETRPNGSAIPFHANEFGLIRPNGNGHIVPSPAEPGVWASTSSYQYIHTKPAYDVAQSSEQYGLRVWQPSGALAFDSGHRNLSVVGKVEMGRQSAAITVNLPASLKTRAVIALEFMLFWADTADIFNMSWYSPGCQFINNNTLRFYTYRWYYPKTDHWPLTHVAWGPPTAQFHIVEY
jgi:hypothetical protein